MLSRRRNQIHGQEACVKTLQKRPAVALWVILDSRVLKWEELVLQARHKPLGCRAQRRGRQWYGKNHRSSIYATDFTINCDAESKQKEDCRRRTGQGEGGDTLGEKTWFTSAACPVAKAKRGTHVSKDGVVELCQQHVMDSEITKAFGNLRGNTTEPLLDGRGWPRRLLDCLDAETVGKRKQPKDFDVRPENFKCNCPEGEVLLDFIEDRFPSSVDSWENHDGVQEGLAGSGWRGHRPTRVSQFMGKDRGSKGGGVLCVTNGPLPDGVNRKMLVQTRSPLCEDSATGWLARTRY